MKIFFIEKSFLILFFIFAFSCKNKEKDQTSLGVTDCVMNSVISSDCVLSTANLYYYDSAFGGRSTTITGSLSAVDNSQSLVLPDGWYSGGVSVSFSSTFLTLANASRIKSGVDLFGVTGSFVTAASPACDVLAANGLQSSTCSASIGNFLYSVSYNGRSTSCSNIDNGLTNANCWVSTTGLQIDTVPTNPTACSVNGLQSSICSATASTYFYNSLLGGRSADCVDGYNSSACWVTSVGKFLTSSSSACVDNSFNSLTCSTNPGRYVYTTEYGGRNADCTNNSAGSCYVTQASKAALDSSLSADKIKIGVTIFGVTGTFAGSGDWPSTAHRSQDTSPISIIAESNVYAGSGTTPNLPGGYRQISSITKDDDGLFSTEVTPVNRTGWGAITCGITQNTLLARITDCETIFGSNASWDGGISGNAGQVRWKLISRSGDVAVGRGREVWYDEKTKLLWSSLVSRNLNWCKAVGSSNNAAVIARYRENDAFDFCDQDTYQNNTSGNVISACFEETGFTTTDTNIDILAKTGLALLATGSSPAVAWRLPTMNDYEVAEAHGIRFVLPDMGRGSTGQEWIATTYSNDKAKAWTFASDTGLQAFKNRNLTSLARCVGR